ncbi:Outer membrane protein-like protein [Candidatus Ruthia magnifica str. Cm (Calyptogena magnifica)]|uniref:Outer membrane protein-like protein n=1 Tax=Ruthia magnifica subsp. Calyptogena magnifica TaxID=413404 RepID=A1AWM6_RUTMC|nr:TolC family protein [Candidatus Ruthturnera calyptogenae]ABL02333.1 Outer membrane protein-like protein [Candidatus Ruthia magnifica str. Cm (Calyptogena magnifica)]
MKKNLTTALIFITCLDVQAITQNEFIKRLKDTHPFFTQLDLSVQIKKIDQQATTANQDWIVSVNTNFKSEDVNNISSITTYNNLNTTLVDFSATKKIVSLGANITLKHSWKDKNKATTASLNTNRNKFSIDYVHPLLKNASGINDRLNIDLSNIDIQISKLEATEQQEVFILTQLKKFIDLAYAQVRLMINNQRLNLAIQELTLVKQKFTMLVVDKVDVLLQEDAYQSAKQQQLQAQQDLNILRHEMAITLDISFSDVKAEFDLYQRYTTNDDNLKQYLLTNSRILKIADLSQDLLKRQLKSDRNNSKVQLDLKFGISSEGEDSRYIDSIFNQSPSWNIGLELSYPIGSTQAKSTIEKTQIKLARAKEQKQEKLLNIHAKAKALKQKIQYLVEILESNKMQIKIAKARTKEEKRRYNNTNSQTSFVISAQNNEQSVNLNHIQVAKKYQQSVLDFKATIDQLLP